VDFSRDGFQLVIVGVNPGAEFRDEWRQTATQLGYTVEQLEADESPPGWPEDAWVLRLTATEQSADQSGWKATVRRAVTRLVQALKDRLRE